MKDCQQFHLHIDDEIEMKNKIQDLDPEPVELHHKTLN